jgi:hypothetical protein
MLDLKKLEEKLDIALSLETDLSLQNWLASKRKNTISSFIGIGDIVAYRSNKFSYRFSQFKNSFHFNENLQQTTSINYELAD